MHAYTILFFNVTKNKEPVQIWKVENKRHQQPFEKNRSNRSNLKPQTYNVYIRFRENNDAMPRSSWSTIIYWRISRQVQKRTNKQTRDSHTFRSPTRFGWYNHTSTAFNTCKCTYFGRWRHLLRSCIFQHNTQYSLLWQPFNYTMTLKKTG